MWREVVREAVPFRHGEHADLGAHLGEDLVDARAARRVVLGMQAEIEQRELELAHGREAGLESARAQQLRLLVRGQRLAGFEMARHRRRAPRDATRNSP